MSVLAVVTGLWCCFPGLSILESFALISFSTSWIDYGPTHPTQPSPNLSNGFCLDIWTQPLTSSLCINLLFVIKLGFYFSELDLGLSFLVHPQSQQLLKNLNHFIFLLFSLFQFFVFTQILLYTLTHSF